MKALSVGVIAFLALAFCPAAVKSQGVPFDHLKCYKIKDTRVPAAKEHRVTLVPEQSPPFEAEQCVVKMKAKLFCIDVQKTSVEPPPGGEPSPGPPAADYLCYKFKGKCNPSVRKDFKIDVTDQFAAGTIVIKKAGMLCAPATKGLPTTTTTTVTTTTTTTTTTMPHFTCDPTIKYPECDGTCPPPLVCQDSGGVGFCECQTPQSFCEDPQNPFGPPLCWGDCPGLPPLVCQLDQQQGDVCRCLPAP